jgi:hypothetical protein
MEISYKLRGRTAFDCVLAAREDFSGMFRLLARQEIERRTVTLKRKKDIRESEIRSDALLSCAELLTSLKIGT